MLSRISNPGAEQYELLGPHGSSSEIKNNETPKRPSLRAYHSPSDPSYASLNQRQTSYATDNGLLRQSSTIQGPQPDARYSKSLFDFLRRNRLLWAALAVGIAGSLGSFGFTFWLSHQIFECPAWSIRCNVKSSVHTFTRNLGLVQGFVSSIYGISIASIAYATYQLAETTVWPMLTEQPLTLEAIDRYLAHARGSLPSFPLAIWHTRRSKHVIVVLIVGVVGLLLQAAATIVGWAFTVVPVPTHLQSNHTVGGGMGFGFGQWNPPFPRPGAPSNALAIYSGWSNTQIPEVLPDLREYLIDRTNFSAIGNFTVHALQARKTVNCHGKAINILTKPSDYSYLLFAVETSSQFGGGFMGEPGQVLLRFLPNTLSVWVHDYQEISDTRLVTNLMFAIVNGTFENGLNHQYRGMTNRDCLNSTYYPCTGISAIQCDVDLQLSEERVCNGPCQESKSKSLTSLNMTNAGGSHPALALYLGAVSSVLAPSINGGQPTYATGYYQENTSLALPIGFSDLWPGPAETAETQHWTIANLTNFINVSAGALGTYVAQDWPSDWTIVHSTLDMLRLDPQRSYSLLAPPAIALICLIAVAALSLTMHKHAGVDTIKLGSTSEILVRTADGEVRSLVDGIRAGYTKAEELDKKTLWFGQLPDGRAGLGASVQSLAESRRSSRAPSYRDRAIARPYI